MAKRLMAEKWIVEISAFQLSAKDFSASHKLVTKRAAWKLAGRGALQDNRTLRPRRDRGSPGCLD
jgi:hypothetical protein